ncbi:MAG: oligosaccharide flippase family protein, partial [Bacteroidota bacterium]
MGIIQRQSIKQSLVNYLAVAVAAVSVILIYPQDYETYGIARFVIDTATFFAPFIMIGFAGVTVRFFPDFRHSERDRQGFLFFVLSGVLVGSLLFVGGFFLFRENLYAIYADKGTVYQQFLPYVVPIAILMAFFSLLFNYSSNFRRIVVPSIFQNFIKLSLPVLILLYVWKYLELEQVIHGILLNYILALLGVIGYIYYLGQLQLRPDFRFLSREKWRKIRHFALFGLFGSIGSVLAFKIDSIMIASLVDFRNNGVFAVAAFIGNAIAIPTNAIMQITGPIVAESFKKQDLAHIEQLYKSASINLLAVGWLLLVCIAASIHDLFALMPNDDILQGGVAVVLLVGLSKIVDMATSINNQIINYSQYYRFGFYAILLMALFNVLTNLLLIPQLQIVGAALATLISLSLYNLTKLIFIWWRFRMQPFSWKSLQVLLIGV